MCRKAPSTMLRCFIWVMARLRFGVGLVVPRAAGTGQRTSPQRPALSRAARCRGERESALEHSREGSEMAVMHDRPYTQFNFLVDIGDGNTEGPSAGFQEVSAIHTEVTVTEYRN